MSNPLVGKHFTFCDFGTDEARRGIVRGYLGDGFYLLEAALSTPTMVVVHVSTFAVEDLLSPHEDRPTAWEFFDNSADASRVLVPNDTVDNAISDMENKRKAN